MDQTPGQSSAPPAYRADWYPDPTGRFEFRYHNGQIWTGDVSVDGHRFLDPMMAVHHSSSASSSTAKASAAFVLGLSSLLAGWVPFLCFLAIVAAILGFVLGVSSLRRDRRNRAAGQPNPRGHGLALAGVILAPFGLIASGIGIWLSVISIREVDEYTNIGNYVVEETRCDVVDGVAHYAGTITNGSSKQRSYTLLVHLVRPGTDNTLYTDSTTVDDVAPGAVAPWSVMVVVREESLECRVEDVTGPVPFADD